MAISPETVLTIATRQGWEELPHKGTKTHVRLKRGTQTLDIHCDVMSVGKTGTKGRPTWKKDVTMPQLYAMLRNRRKLPSYGTIRRMGMKSRHVVNPDEMYDPNYFDGPESNLLDRLWDLKPKWWEDPITRDKKRGEALRIIAMAITS